MAHSAVSATKTPITEAAKPVGKRLTLDGLLDDLVADKLVTKEDAARLKADRRLNHGDHHPLVVLGEQKLKDPRHAKKTLHLEVPSVHDGASPRKGLGP